MEVLKILGFSFLGFLIFDILFGKFFNEVKCVDVDGNFTTGDGCCCRFSTRRKPLKFGFITFNLVRRIACKSPILFFPPYEEKIGDRIVKVNREEISSTVSCYFLFVELKHVLRKSHIPILEKLFLKREALKIPIGIQNALWKLYRVRRIKALIKEERNQNYKNANNIENCFLSTIEEAKFFFASIPILIMSGEFKENDKSIRKCISNLKDFNSKLRSYDSDIRKIESLYKI